MAKKPEKTNKTKQFEDIFNLPETTNAIAVLDEKGNEILDEEAIEHEHMTLDAMEDTAYDEDFDFVRENLIDIIEMSKGAAAKLQMVADEGESARAFEVLGDLVRTSVAANKELLEIRKKRMEHKDRGKTMTGGKGGQVVNVDKAVFTGSSSDLRQAMKDGTI
jgi:hypothetical protein